jgi:iron complex outermembrane receptor protein
MAMNTAPLTQRTVFKTFFGVSMLRQTKLCTSLAIAFGGLALIPQIASAQSASLERVEITGSAIKRVAAESALPVSTITRADIERSGATTAQDLVSLIPSNFGGTVISTNVGSTGNASTANLRQLGSKYTLVLLNGRRIANYAFGNAPVDLNSIPVSAIERVEVLRDGASAIYGADAIAGVINFILRKDFQGMELSAYATKVAATGGGDTRTINFSGGYGDINTQQFNVMFSFNRETNESLKAKDRVFANSAKRDDLGIDNSSSRNAIPNLVFNDTKGNFYAGVNPLRYKGCDAPEFALNIRNDQACGTDYVKFIDLIPKADHDNFVTRGVFQINSDHQLYAEGAYTKDKVVASYSPAPFTNPFAGYPSTGRFYPSSITLPKGMTLPSGYIMPNGSVLTADTVLSADMAVTPTGPIAGRWRTVAGGGRNDVTETTNTRLLWGAKGVIANWDYDTAITYSKNDGTVSFGPGQYGYAALTPLLESGAINIFGPQDAASQTALETARLTGPQRKATSESTELDLRVSKELDKWTYGTLAVALGSSIRQENLDQFSYPVLASGDPVGGDGPVPGVTGSRKVFGLFGEVSVPLYKDLELQAAARYDSLENNFGTSFSKVSPKVALRFQPTKELLLRSSYGQGYRAPTLYENLRPFTSGGATAGVFSDPVRCPNGVPISNVNAVGVLQDECGIQLVTATQGDRELKPEQSKQFSFGMVFQPTTNLSGSLDYWEVKIDDAIVQKSEIQVMSDPSKYASYFYRYNPALYPTGWSDDGSRTGAIKGSTNPDFPIAYIFLPFENTASIFAAGIDINLNYKKTLAGLGRFGVNFDGTLYTKHGYQYPGVPEVNDNGSYQDFGSTPKWRHAVTVTYGMGDWNASLTQNYTQSYKDFTDPASVGAGYPAERIVSAYQTYDTQVVWTAVKNLDLTFGVRNLTDQDPPSSRKSSGFQVGYDEKNTNPLGRAYYLRAKYKF